MYQLSQKASDILARKEKNWGCFLTFEILAPEIDRLLGEFDEMAARPPVVSHVLGRKESLVFCDLKIAEVHDAIPKLVHLLNVTLREAWGPPGESGNAEAIVAACRRILGICDAFLDWERSLKTTALHADCGQFARQAPGMAKGYLEEIRRALAVLRSEAEKPSHDQVVKIEGDFDDKQIRGVTFGRSEESHESSTLWGLVAGFLFGRFVLWPLLWLFLVALFWLFLLGYLDR